MKLKLILYLFIPLILLSCNKKVASELSSDKSLTNDQIHTGIPSNFVPSNNAGPNDKEFDPNEFPPRVIHTIEELDDWIEINGSVVVSYFRPSRSNPYFAMDEELIQYLVDLINSSERSTYRLVGHTHNQGNDESNKKLSVHRAMATMEVMLNKYGLRLSKNGAYGEGESNPLNNNETLEDIKMNSRVELRRLK